MAFIGGGRRGRVLACSLAVVVTAALIPLGPAGSPAYAAGTTLFDQPFHDNTADGTGAVVKPALSAGGTNAACLTEVGNPSTGVLTTCSHNTDSTSNSGKLRLTDSTTGKTGGVFGATSVPTSQGLDVTFNTYQYGGTQADGIAFAVAAVDPATPTAPSIIGLPGGNLGYSGTTSANGLDSGYLGIGLDVYGNFSNNKFEGSGCSDPAYIGKGTAVPGQVVVRGPGRGTVGYCALNSTATSTSSSSLALHASTRAASAVPVEVVVNPTSSSLTTTSGLVVGASSYEVVVTPIGGSARTLTGALPAVSAGLYPSSSWLTGSGIPKQLAFGWVASTGALTDYHEIDNVKVTTFNPVPQLGVATVGYNAATPSVGSPVTYVVTPSVAAGSSETSPVSVTLTAPAGVTPLGAFGAGWTCGSPSGQQITCTNGNAPFASGASLNPVTVDCVVTSSSVTASTIQSGTTTTSSSADGGPGYASTAAAGTLPTAPSGITVTPSSGSISGGGAVTVGGSNISAATAIVIGTTAEQQTGTAVVLLPCATGVTSGCFTANGNGTLAIASMPARSSAGAVSITVITQGVAASGGYTYNSAPGTPAAPTAAAGITSATVSWTAPAANGSTITGYVVTPYENGVARTAVSYDASTTTRTLTGLTAGASYTFTVAAVNSVGTGAASPASSAVVPYAVPSAPTIGSATAGTAAATLSWSAPSANGSTIVGYVVTPYLGAVPQTPQTFNSTATTQTVSGLIGGATYTFTVAAVNAAGAGPASAPSTAVTVNALPSLTFAAPPGGEVGTAYSDALTVSGGTAPYTWSVSSGGLPPGLALDPSTGLLSGTPTTAGTFSFTVMVTDSSGTTATHTVSLTIAAALVLTTPAPPSGEVGVGYTYALTKTGGVGPYTWSLVSGSLPAGVALNTGTGALSGTPTTAGSSSAVVKVQDALGRSATGTVAVTVLPRPSLSLPSPQAGQVGLPYGDQLSADGGTAPITWSVTAGTLPTGLSLAASTGLLSGTPTAVGTYSFTVTATDANGVTASQVLTVTVSTGPLTIVNSTDAASAAQGGRVHYTVTVTNGSAVAFTGVAFADALAGVLDDAVYGGDASASTGTVGFNAATGVLSWTGNLAAGATATIAFSAVVANPDTGDMILNSAITSPTLGTTCPAGGTDVRCGSTVTVAKLTIVNSADAASTTPGGVVRFTVTAANAGKTPLTGISLTSSAAGVFDDAVPNGDQTASSGTLAVTASGVTWSGSIAVGATLTITGTVTVLSPDPGDKALTSTVTTSAQGANCPSGTTDPLCSVTVPVLVPGLTMSQSTDTTTALPGGTVHYTVTVANSGQTPYSGAAFTDSLAGVLDDASYNGDASATSGTVSFTSPNLGWSGDLAIGASATITFSVTVANPDLSNKVLSAAITSSALGGNCPASGGTAQCDSTVGVLTPQLTIVKTGDAATVLQGGTVHYTVTVTNSGQIPYTGASFSDALAGVLDDASYNGDASATSGTVAFASPNVTWSGNLAVGASVTVTYSVAVANPDTGDKALTNILTSPTNGANCPAGNTDTRCNDTVSVTSTTPLTFVNTAAVASAAQGGTVHYSVTATNSGSTPYTGAAFSDALADVLDDASYNGDASATSGAVSFASSTVTWSGNLAVGASATVTFSATVANPDTGNLILGSAITSSTAGNNCPSGGGDARCASTVTVSRLVIVNSAGAASTTPGGVVRFTLTASNTGRTPLQGVTMFTSAADVFDDAVPNGDQTASFGTLAVAPTGVTWSGAIPVGATLTITGTVTVLGPDPGNKDLVSTVTTSAQGANCPSGTTDPLCSVNVPVLTPGLTIVKTADASAAVPGGTVHYTITVTDSGQTPYSGAALTDDFTHILDDAVYNGDASATAGTVAYQAPHLTWTGDLAVGASATITYSVTVDNPDTDGKLLAGEVASNAPGSNCPVGGGDARCSSTVVVLTPALTTALVSDTGSVVQGGVVHYTVTVANTGQIPYTGASFTDSLAGVLDDAAYDADAAASAGSAAFAGSTLTWTGDLALGASATVTYSVTAADPDHGDGTLANVLTSATPGTNCAAGSTDSRCASTVSSVAPTIALTALPSGFSLAGLPNTVAELDDAVTMNIATDSPLGYSVSVQSENAALTCATAGNDDVIPIADLGAREHGAATFVPLSANSSVLVHTQSAPSAPGGDTIGTDYRVAIPAVRSGPYSAVLDYVSMTL
jgi:uncharacterized repeat protein (TIGR01451 family)